MKVGPFEIVRSMPENGHVKAEEPSYGEVGGTGQTKYNSLLFGEYNSALYGTRAIETYQKMRRGDGKVRGVMRVVKAPITSAQWYMEPASNSELDQEVSDFVWWSLNNMSRTFMQFISESLLFMDYGHYLFEKVYKTAEWKGKTRVCWRKFAPRHPLTIDDWVFDANGGLQGIRQNRNYQTAVDLVDIPIDKLLVFTFDEEGGDPRGLSILRSAYKHWFYKENLYKVDAIQKERHALGIPEVELPMGFTAEDKRLANEMAQNIRTNERAFIVRPPNFKISFLELSGEPVDALKSAEHHDMMIAVSALAQFLNIGATAVGSRATADVAETIFTKSLRFVADLIREVINQYAIPQLVDYNYDVEAYPKLRVRRIGENADWRALSVALRNLVETRVITPDPELERFMRDFMDFPASSAEVDAFTVEDRMASRENYSNRVEKPTE